MLPLKIKGDFVYSSNLKSTFAINNLFNENVGFRFIFLLK